MPADWLVISLRWAISEDSEVAPGERRRSGDRTAEGRHGVGGVCVGSMVIITGLAAGQATAGAAVSDGRSRNVGNGAAMAGPGGRRQARVRRVRAGGWRGGAAKGGVSGWPAGSGGGGAPS